MLVPSVLLLRVVLLAHLLSCSVLVLTNQQVLAYVGVCACHCRLKLTTLLMIVLLMVGVAGERTRWRQIPMRNTHVVN